MPTETAAKKKAAAKKSEKTIKFRGIDLKLPKALPSEIAFQYFELVEGEVGLVQGSIRMLRTILGEGQWAAVRAKLAEDAVPMTELEGVLGKLSQEVFDAFDMTPGK